MDRQPELSQMRSLGQRVALSLAAALLLTNLSGCQIVIGVLMMLKGPPTITCHFTQLTGKSLTGKDKKVIILSSSNGSAQSELPSLDIDIVTEVSRRLKNQHVRLIDSNDVATWIDDHGGVESASDVAAIGKQFDADYVILFRFNEFGFRETNSGPLFYRGHARGRVDVVEMAAATDGSKNRSAHKIYQSTIDSNYPVNAPAPADGVSPTTFQKRYLDRVSDELARLFYDHPPGDEVP